MGNGIHGWIGGRYGSPTEYGRPLDDSYLFEENEEPEEEEPQPCPCAGAEWIGCYCQPLAEAPAFEDLAEPAAPSGDDWTPVKIREPEVSHAGRLEALPG